MLSSEHRGPGSTPELATMAEKTDIISLVQLAVLEIRTGGFPSTPVLTLLLSKVQANLSIPHCTCKQRVAGARSGNVLWLAAPATSRQHVTSMFCRAWALAWC